MGSLIKETPFSEITATLEILDHFGVGREDLTKFRAAAPEVKGRIAQILRTADSLVRISTITNSVNPLAVPVQQRADTITVDYSLSLAEMIAVGRYDWSSFRSSDTTHERFPLAGVGVVEFETRLFHFDRKISSKDAFNAVKSDGWQPAKIEHLLAFGAKYPEEQCKYQIVCLGSSARVSGYRHVPCLNRVNSGRCLSLPWWRGDWDGYCRFLAVRKLSSGA